MQIYDSEQDQVEVIRNFFRENGKAIILGVILGAGGLFGWEYWKSHKLNSATEAAVGFHQVYTELQTDKQGAVVQTERFIQENKNTYGVFAALSGAQYLVDKGEFANAQTQLESARDAIKDESLSALLNLRIARLQAEQQQFEQALQTLTHVKGEGWEALMQEIRGDILVSKGDVEMAKAAYQAGLLLNTSPAYQEVVRMKLNNIVA